MSEAHSILSMSDEEFGWYFTGLTDGEGHFGLGKKYKLLRGWYICFIMNFRDDEEDNFRALMSRFGVGKLWPKFSQSMANRSKPQLSCRIAKLDDLANFVVPHFDRFPLQMKKSRDFLAWRPCVLLLHKIKCRTARGLRKANRETKMTAEEDAFLQESHNRLVEGRKYRSPPCTATLKLPAPRHEPPSLFDGV